MTDAEHGTPPGRQVTRSEPLHQQIARTLRNQIEAGRLRDGEVLPSTREMAAQWDVSVYTINEAMRVLAEEGIVENQSRSKRVVRFAGSRQMIGSKTSPHVVLIGGYAGSGKSELGRIVARLTGWPMLDKDTLTRPVVEAALEIAGQSPHDRESPVYVNQIRPYEYEALRAAVNENLECGNSAVVTAPFIREFADRAWLDRTLIATESLGATVSIVWIYCDANTMRRYIRQRGAARDTAKLSSWDEYLSSIDVEFRPPTHHYLIENSASSAPLQTQAENLMRSLIN